MGPDFPEMRGLILGRNLGLLGGYCSFPLLVWTDKRSEVSSEFEKNAQSFVKSCLYFVDVFVLFVYTVTTLFAL